MGGKSDDSSSREMINMQKEEAAAARQKEEERKARIKQGLTRISQAFEGTPVMGKKDKTFTYAAPATGAATAGGAVAGLPAGYTYVADPATVPAPGAALPTSGPAPGSAAGGRVGANEGYVNRNVPPAQQAAISAQTAAATAPTGYLVKGPDGKTYKVGDTIKYQENYDTGKKTGGIGSDFFNKFKQGILDYYMPDVKTKYGDARDELTYRLARAGTLRSSVAADETADLAKQNMERQAEVRSKADQAAADLKTRTAAEKAKAESQLYATENPDVAANQATAAIRNITAETPTLTPLGEIFDLASIGGAGYLKGAQNASLSKKYSPGTAAGGRII